MSSKEGRLYDTMQLSAKMYGVEEISFPINGITLCLEDYDGDGEKNDFSLGQGQFQMVAAGNFMNYAFYEYYDHVFMLFFRNLTNHMFPTIPFLLCQDRFDLNG